MSPSDEFFQALEPACTWRGKSRRWRLWRLAWKRAIWMPRRFGETFARSQPSISEDVLTWWSAAFPARTSALPASGPASSENDPDSSSTLSDSFATWEPATSSWRTLQPSLFGDSTPYSARWPKSGSLRNGAVSRRQTLVRLMAAIGGGASRGDQKPAASAKPTPQAADGENQDDFHCHGLGNNLTLIGEARRWPTPSVTSGAQTSENPTPGQTGGTTLGGAARDWQTPRVSSASRRGGSRSHETLLPDQARQWATPSARDWRSGEASDDTMQRNARPLNEQASHWPTPSSEPFEGQELGVWEARMERLKALHHNGNGAGRTLDIAQQQWSRTHQARQTETAGEPTSTPTPTSRLQLNPQFVEALMGLAPGWTDFEGSATPSSQIRPSGHCAASGSEHLESGHER